MSSLYVTLEKYWLFTFCGPSFDEKIETVTSYVRFWNYVCCHAEKLIMYPYRVSSTLLSLSLTSKGRIQIWLQCTHQTYILWYLGWNSKSQLNIFDDLNKSFIYDNPFVFKPASNSNIQPLLYRIKSNSTESSQNRRVPPLLTPPYPPAPRISFLLLGETSISRYSLRSRSRLRRRANVIY